MAKTFIPSLRDLVRKLCIYIARYQDTIRANLAGDALAAFDALSLACDAFLASLGPDIPNP